MSGRVLPLRGCFWDRIYTEFNVAKADADRAPQAPQAEGTMEEPADPQAAYALQQDVGTRSKLGEHGAGRIL